MDKECGYNCEVVGGLPLCVDVHCSYCIGILRRPYLLGCCGHHLCEPCLGKLETASRPCPLCRTETFDSLLDLRVERLILDLTVACAFRDGGCEWTGSLRDLDKHVSNVCLFVLVSCPWECDEKVPKQFLEEHKLSLCPKRPWYVAYKDADTRDLAERVDTLSREKQILANEFDKLKATLDSIQDEKETLKREMSELRDAQASKFDELKATLESVLEEKEVLKKQHEKETLKKQDEREALKKEVDELRDAHSSNIEELRATVDSLSTALHELKTAPSASVRSDSTSSEPTASIASPLSTESLLIAPTSFTVTEVNRRKKRACYSPFFLSHARGYQLQLRVDCGGVMDGEGTHLSVFVYVAKGEQDKNLKWPFEGSVTVCLIDQQGSIDHEKIVEFPKGLSSDIAGRVEQGVRAKQGQGFAQFLPLEDLSSYVKDKTLSFSVIVAVVKPKRLLAGLFQ